MTRPTVRPSKSNTQDPESPLAEELSSFGKEIIGASQRGYKFESGCAYRAFEGRRGLECYYACSCLDFLDETIIPLRCAENSMSRLSKLGILQILLVEMPVSITDNNILFVRYLEVSGHISPSYRLDLWCQLSDISLRCRVKTIISKLTFQSQCSRFRDHELIDGNVFAALLSSTTVFDTAKRCLGS